MGLCRNLTILICHIQQLTFGWGWDFKVKKGGMGGLAEKNTLETPLTGCMTIGPITILYAPVVQKVGSAMC